MKSILGNPGVTHSVTTAFMMNAVGTKWITSGLPRMLKKGQMPYQCFRGPLSFKFLSVYIDHGVPEVVVHIMSQAGNPPTILFGF